MTRTLFSIVRLWLGCFMLLWGISWGFAPVQVEALVAQRAWGLIMASAGLAMSLQETVYIHSRFMRGTEK